VGRLFTAFVLLGVAACGKSRLAGETTAGWDEPTAANGFHGESDSACSKLCVPKVDADRRKHAVRTAPVARMVTRLLEPSRAGLVYYDGCVLGASSANVDSGWSWCFEPREGSMRTILSHEAPSALAVARRTYTATRNVNGGSMVRQENVILAAEESDVRALVALDDEACWIDANERVRCAHAADSATVTTVAHAPGLDARFLAMDSDSFYVVRGGWIARLVRGGSRLDTIAKTGSPIRDLIVSDGWIYWVEQGEPRLECQPDGTMPSCSARSRVLRHPFGTLQRARIADRKASVLANDLEEADGMLLVNEHVYVSTREGLVRVPISGSSPTVLPTGEPVFGRPALDPVSWTVYVQAKGKLLAVEP
jgi:hypothetical protein